MEKYSRPCFRGFLETKLAKFDKEDETFVNVGGVIRKKDSGGNVTSIDNEYSVVISSLHMKPIPLSSSKFLQFFLIKTLQCLIVYYTIYQMTLKFQCT